MKNLERYVFGAFLSSFLLAFLVLSFVLTIGLMVQIVSYILQGVPMDLVGRFALVSFPETMQWTVPIALLVSSILVFSRLSADSEIAAMRACGVNLLTVMRWPLAFALLCTFVCLFVNNEIVPRGHEVRRTLKAKVSVQTGLSVLEPGRVIDDFPRVKLYFSRKEGNWLHDLVVLDFSNPKFDRLITADKALVTQEGKDVGFELYHMTVDPMDENHRTMARANRFVYTMTNVIKRATYVKRNKDFRFGEMFDHMRLLKKALASPPSEGKVGKVQRDFARRELSGDKVELNKRFVFAMASLCFVMIGIPLGIRSQRKESTVGMAISLAVSLGYYVVVILMISCEGVHWIHPEVLIWLPVVACLILAAKLMKRHL